MCNVFVSLANSTSNKSHWFSQLWKNKAQKESSPGHMDSREQLRKRSSGIDSMNRGRETGKSFKRQSHDTDG